jgi:hypothetical protein
MLTSMKLIEFYKTLMVIVKYGESSTQYKNQLIGLYGHTQNQKDGVID